MPNITAAQRAAVIASVMVVAANCDGARSRDEVGFNGQDTLFGKRLAALAGLTTEASDVTDEMVEEAAHMMVKYSGQVVAAVGQDVYALVVEASKIARRNAEARQDARRALNAIQGRSRRVARVEDGRLVFDFPFDGPLKDALKAQGARWDAARKVWWVDAARVTAALQAVVVDAGFRCDDEAEALLNGAPAADSAPANPRQASVKDGLVHLVAPYDAALINALRGLSGRRYVQGDLNTAPLNATTRAFAEAWGFDGLDAIDAALAARSAEEKAAEAARDEVRALSNAMDAEPVEGVKVGRSLFGYQWSGVRYILRQRRVLVGDEMGTGKTTIALAALEAGGTFPAIVVVPEITRTAWAREAAKVVPHRTVQVVEGTAPQALHGDIIVIGYTVLQHHTPAILAYGPRALVVDEAHMVKTPKAARTQAVAAIAEVIPA